MISHKGPDVGFGFLLGGEYERRKQKLQEELHLDFTRHLSQKKLLRGGEARAAPEALSLPIDEKESLKEKLRDERNREYNLFLQTQAQSRKFKRSPSSCIPAKVQHATPPEEAGPPRRDAVTLTESVDPERPSDVWAPRRRRRWHDDRPRESGYSQDELNTDEDAEFESRCRMRQDRHARERPREEWRRPDCGEKRTQINKETDSHPDQEQNSNGGTLESARTGPASPPGISKLKPETVTGLMIGANEGPSAVQRRKEEYKRELLKQMAEQERNRIKEKILELRVAATGATDPEKDPERLKHLGAVDWQQHGARRDVARAAGKHLEAEDRSPNTETTGDKWDERSGASRVDHGAAPRHTPGRREPPRVRPLDTFSEDYHKDFSSMLGEMAVPKVAAFDPLIPPTVSETCRTPYDAAYHYYGARNPVEPCPPFNQSRLLLPVVPPGGDGHSGNGVSPQWTSRLKSHSLPEWTPQPGAMMELHRVKRGRESPRSYQEALRQQIKEREEQRRREKSKVEAEVSTYDPWGRGGCGAPITDQSGDIFCDLKKMHRFNEEPVRNGLFSPLHQSPGSRTEPQRNSPSKYMEALKLQMEVNRVKQEEERERARLEEENEEKRLAAERARLLQEYEQEKQREQEKIERCRVQIPPAAIKPATPTRREEQSKEALQHAEEEGPQVHYKREVSAPVPTHQKKHGAAVETRPASVESQLHARTEHFVSTPQQRLDPAAAPRPPEGQQEVIRALSKLRRHLSKEQKQLELQLSRRGPEKPPDSAPTRQRIQVDTLEPTPRKAAARPYWRPLRTTARVNVDNIREFTHLKSRDTDSREEVRALFPDPPTDAQTLDLQQLALLRQQRRSIGRMSQQQLDFQDNEETLPYPSRKHVNPLHTERSLPSDTAFIEFYGGDGCEETSQPSPEPRDPAARRRSRGRDGRSGSVDVPSLPSASSSMSSEVPAPEHRLDNADQSKAEGRWDDEEVDVSSLRSVLEGPVYAETVATEPWLRPGSSDNVIQDVYSSLNLDLPSAAPGPEPAQGVLLPQVAIKFPH